MLNCKANGLKELNFGSISNISWLDCSFNELSDLNLDKFDALNTLYCQHNYLENITFNSTLDEELYIEAQNNDLESLAIGLAEIKCDSKVIIHGQRNWADEDGTIKRKEPITITSSTYQLNQDTKKRLKISALQVQI